MTYRAIIRGDRIEWEDQSPARSEKPLAVEVTVLEPVDSPTSESRKAAAEALERLAKRGTAFAEIEDPVAWQREIRNDRPLPGRE